MKNLKLQSAMEYLMTYGWAILIIAVVMVALFSLGILGGSPLSTTCLPQSGYQCSGVTYNHGTVGTYPADNVVLTVGQTTGTNWESANVFFVPQGTALTAAGVPVSITNPAGAQSGTGNTIGYCGAVSGSCTATALSGTGLLSGQTAQIALGVPTAATSVTVGQSASGTVWVQYTTAPGTFYYAQLATITLKAA